MVRWLERVVTAWLRSVAPSGWTDSVEGDLREDLAPRRPSGLRTLMAMAAIAMRINFGRCQRSATPSPTLGSVVFSTRWAAALRERPAASASITIF